MRLTSPQSKFRIVVDHIGAHISSIVSTDSETELLLQTPWADENWGTEFPAVDAGEEWHRRYPGGWHTLVPHSGNQRRFNGVDHPFHGEAAWRQWRVIHLDGNSCTFEVVLRTVPFKVTRRIEARDNGVFVEQSVENMSSDQVSFTWTEHPAFGDALVGTNSELTLSGQKFAANFSRSGFQEPKVPGSGQAELHNPDTGYTAKLSWDPQILPYMYVWQEHRSSLGFPWWGSTNTVGLEPASRPYDFEEDSLGPLKLEGGASLSTGFLLELSRMPARTATATTSKNQTERAFIS